MSKGKQVYLVRGSEDGVLGIYTNKKLAWATATDYIKKDGTGYPVEYYDAKPISYSGLCKLHKEKGWLHTTIVNSNDSYGSAIIESFWLNS